MYFPMTEFTPLKRLADDADVFRRNVYCLVFGRINLCAHIQSHVIVKRRKHTGFTMVKCKSFYIHLLFFHDSLTTMLCE